MSAILKWVVYLAVLTASNGTTLQVLLFSWGGGAKDAVQQYERELEALCIAIAIGLHDSAGLLQSYSRPTCSLTRGYSPEGPECCLSVTTG